MSFVSLDCIYPTESFGGNFGGILTKDKKAIFCKDKYFDELFAEQRKTKYKGILERFTSYLGQEKTLEEWAEDKVINMPEWFITINGLHNDFIFLDMSKEFSLLSEKEQRMLAANFAWCWSYDKEPKEGYRKMEKDEWQYTDYAERHIIIAAYEKFLSSIPK